MDLLEVIGATLLPAISLAFGIANGTPLRVILTWVVPLTVLMGLGFVVLPGVVGDVAVGIGVVAFLLMTFPTGFGGWWTRHVVPPTWRE